MIETELRFEDLFSHCDKAIAIDSNITIYELKNNIIIRTDFTDIFDYYANKYQITCKTIDVPAIIPPEPEMNREINYINISMIFIALLFLYLLFDKNLWNPI